MLLPILGYGEFNVIRAGLARAVLDYISFVKFRFVSGFVAEEDRRGCDVLEGKDGTWLMLLYTASSS